MQPVFVLPAQHAFSKCPALDDVGVRNELSFVGGLLGKPKREGIQDTLP